MIDIYDFSWIVFKDEVILQVIYMYSQVISKYSQKHLNIECNVVESNYWMDNQLDLDH